MTGAQKRYLAAHPDRVRASKAAYRERNREKIRKHERERHAQNPDARKEYLSEYRESHREEIRAKGRNYYASNKDKFAAYREVHRDALLAYDRRRYTENRDEILAQMKVYREENADQIRRRKKAEYDRDKDHVLEKARLYRQANLDAVRAKNREYLATHAEQHRLSAKKRAAIIRGARVEPITLGDLNAKLHEYGGLCAYCHERPHRHWDHFIPVSRGGVHSVANLFPSCPPCNHRKGTRLWPAPVPPVMVASPS